MMQGIRRLARVLLAGACALAGGGAACTTGWAAEPPILCEWSHVNFAWGAQLTLIGLTADGRVLYFDSRTPVGGSPQNFDVESLLLPAAPTAADLLRRYGHAWPANRAVTAEDRARIAALAEVARDGAISEPQDRMNDFGATAFTCFVPLADGSVFQPVLIAEGGDRERHNAAPAAAELLDLLTRLLDPPRVTR